MITNQETREFAGALSARVGIDFLILCVLNRRDLNRVLAKGHDTFSYQDGNLCSFDVGAFMRDNGFTGWEVFHTEPYNLVLFQEPQPPKWGPA